MNAITEKPALNVVDTGEFNALMDSDRFGQMQRVGTMFSQSDLVPDVFKGKPANCMVALQMAFRLKIDPLALMQSMFVVHGRPGLESKMIIALINTRGPFDGPIQWRFEGEGKQRSCTAYATHSRTKERCEQTVTWAMVEAEGWSGKSGSKWKTMPDLMFQYRSAAFLGRLYCPEVILGLSTNDELHDMGEIVINPPPQARKQVAMPREKEDVLADVLRRMHGVSQGLKAEREAESVDTQTGEITADLKPASIDLPNLDFTQEAQTPEPTKTAPESGTPATASMIRIVKTKMSNASINESDFEEKFGKPFASMNAADVNLAMAWIAESAKV